MPPRAKRTFLAKVSNAVSVLGACLVAVPFLVLLLPPYFDIGSLVLAAICVTWMPRGKDVLFVSSDNPVWGSYMAEQVLPMVRDRAVILNWSERKQWRRFSISRIAFRMIGGRNNYNPIVIQFRLLRPS